MSGASRLLELARGALELPSLSSEMRLRAAAILTRQALEAAIAFALEADGVDASRLAFRTQLETLRHLRAIDDVVGDASFAWAALSRATHYHGYELPPTREALGDWMRLAEGAVRRLGEAPAAR